MNDIIEWIKEVVNDKLWCRAQLSLIWSATFEEKTWTGEEIRKLMTKCSIDAWQIIKEK